MENHWGNFFFKVFIAVIITAAIMLCIVSLRACEDKHIRSITQESNN